MLVESALIPIEWRLFETGFCLHPEASSRAGASWKACEFPAMVALLRHPARGWILFDTGYGQAFIDATRRLPERAYRWVTPVSWTPQQSAVARIHALGIDPADIKSILISHFHGDHVGALGDFPQADPWCAHPAWSDLHARSRLSALAYGLLPALAPLHLQRRLQFYEDQIKVRLPPALAPFDAGFDLFKDGSILAVPLPGHAPGHFGVCFYDGHRWIFLVADAAWSIQAIIDNAPPPRWATYFLGETQTYRRTLAALHALAARDNGVSLLPAHCRSLR
jgi:glyoxylase-like metal-dependent hydrolase (beta-lactamase superfamily II)